MKPAMKVSPAPVVSTTSTGAILISASSCPSDAMLPSAPLVTTASREPCARAWRSRACACAGAVPAEAKAMGFAHEVTAADALDAKVEELVAALVAALGAG